MGLKMSRPDPDTSLNHLCPTWMSPQSLTSPQGPVSPHSVYVLLLGVQELVVGFKPSTAPRCDTSSVQHHWLYFTGT